MRSRGLEASLMRPPSGQAGCEVTQLRRPITGWRLRAMVVALLVVLTLALPVRAQDGGRVEGQVVNGTEGGAEIGTGLPVTLYVFDASLEEQFLTTETDADGRFVFEGLDTSALLEYWVEASYQNVSYGTENLLQFDEGQTALETTVTVYETTTDDADVRLDLVHVFAESFGEVLRISETHLFGSTGDHAYIGEEQADGRRETVFVPVPGGSVGFALGEGIPEDRFSDASGGLVDSEPVRPGNLMSEVRFSYHLMASGSSILLERSFAYPVSSLTVLVAQPGLSLDSEQLQSMGMQLIQDRQYEILAAENLAADTPVELVFTQTGGMASTGIEGMPSGQVASSGSAGGSQGALLWIGVLVALFTVAGAVVYAATSRRPGSGHLAGGLVVSDPGPEFDPKARELIAKLADLEDAYEAGEVDEAAYVSQRMKLFRELG